MKKLLIFGANGALGKGVTKILSAKSYDEIFLFDSRFNEAEIQGGIKKIIVKDLSKEENVIEAFNNIKTDSNTTLFLFSTIGGFYGGVDLWETLEEDFDRMFDMNIKANYLIAKHFSDKVTKSYGGSICFTSAYTANHPEPGKFAYGSSKAALNYLVKTLSNEGEKINLSVNAIAPFIIDTPANREWMKNVSYESWIKPEEIGELVDSLNNNYNFISGNILELRHRFSK
jgi:NAD(P)-dependent dehydrogenase (short-subunit alcohol dehydrogenase family)